MITLLIFLIILVLPAPIRSRLVIFLIILSFHVVSIVPFQHWLFGSYPLENLLYLFFLVYGFYFSYHKNHNLGYFAIVAIIIGICFLVIQPLYVSWKGSLLFNRDLIPPLVSISKSVNKLILIFLILAVASKSERNTEFIINSIYFSTVILVISVVFNSQLESIGFIVSDYSQEFSEYSRPSGIAALNVNALGAIMAIVLGLVYNSFLLGKLKTNLFLFLTGIIFLGILLTASRTAIISAAIITFIFLIDRNFKLTPRGLLLIVSLGVLSFMGLEFFGDSLLFRFEQHRSDELGGLGTRSGYWLIYMQDMVQNPHYFLMGNTGLPTYPRSPHNYYVLLLFNSGVIFVFLLFFLFLKPIKRYKLMGRYNYLPKHYNLRINPIYIIVPQLLYWIPGVNPVFWWTLILIGLAGFNYSKNEKHTNLFRINEQT